jgi:hypothetical protein
MKCRTCHVIVHHARQCDDCTRQAMEPLGMVALDEDGRMPRRFPWPVLLAVIAAMATGVAYVATVHEAPAFVAID